MVIPDLMLRLLIQMTTKFRQAAGCQQGAAAAISVISRRRGVDVLAIRSSGTITQPCRGVRGSGIAGVRETITDSHRRPSVRHSVVSLLL